MRKYYSEVVHTLLKVISFLQELNRRISNYSASKILNYVEIHMINKIKHYQGLHISVIAKEIEVTRGVVSQMFKKLEKSEWLSENLARIISPESR